MSDFNDNLPEAESAAHTKLTNDTTQTGEAPYSSSQTPHERKYYSPAAAPQYQTMRVQPRSPQIFQTPSAPYSPLSNSPYPPIYPVAAYYPPQFSARKPGERIATASFVCGIVSIFLFWIPIINIVLSLLALIFGIIATAKGSRGLAIAGIILGFVGLVLSVIFLIFIYVTITSSGSFDNNALSEWEYYTT